MKILVNEDLYTWVDAMYKHCTSCPGDKVQLLDGFLVMGDDSKIRTEDGKAIITLSGERDLRIICFESTSNCLDPIDMPITLKIPIDEKATIDTDTFQITYADPKEYDKEDIPVHELKKTEEFYKLFGESFKEAELKSYRRFGKPSEIADQLEELRQYKLREENKIDDAYENIDTEAARKLIGSLNNDIRRLFKGEIKQDLHVSCSDRLIKTLNRVYKLGDTYIRRSKPVISLIVKAVDEYNEAMEKNSSLKENHHNKLVQTISQLLSDNKLPELCHRKILDNDLLNAQAAISNREFIDSTLSLKLEIQNILERSTNENQKYLSVLESDEE